MDKDEEEVLSEDRMVRMEESLTRIEQKLEDGHLVLPDGKWESLPDEPEHPAEREDQ